MHSHSLKLIDFKSEMSKSLKRLVLPGTHLHMSQVKHVRVKCLAQRHNIETLILEHDISLKILHQAESETPRQSAILAMRTDTIMIKQDEIDQIHIIDQMVYSYNKDQMVYSYNKITTGHI